MAKRRKLGKVVSKERYNFGGESFLFELRLVSDRSRYRTTFTYLVDHDEPQVCVEDTDPTECVKKAREAFAEALKREWKPMLLVRVDPNRDHSHWSGRGDDRLHTAKLQIDVHALSVSTEDGGEMKYRFGDRGMVQTGSPTSDGESMIPDTPESREKLKQITDGLELLGTRLADFLSQERIAKALTNAPDLLPAPKTKAKTRRGAK